MTIEKNLFVVIVELDKFLWHYVSHFESENDAIEKAKNVLDDYLKKPLSDNDKRIVKVLNVPVDESGGFGLREMDRAKTINIFEN